MSMVLIWLFLSFLPSFVVATPLINLTIEEQHWIQQHPDVHVGGSPDWTPFNFVNEQGDHSGIASDYLSLIAQKTGLNFKVSIDTWSTNLQKIRNSEIDLLPAVYYTDERSQYLLFSKPYLEVLDYFFVREDIDVEAIEDLNGKRVALPKGYAHVDLIKQHFPKIKIVTVDTFGEAIDAVLEKRADILYDTYGSLIYTLEKEGISTIIPFKSTRHLGKNNIHIVTRKESPILASIIQKGLNAVSPEEKRMIFDKWLSRNRVKEQTIPFTAEEKQWLLEHQTVRLGVDSNWPPYEYFDKTGQFQGIAAEIVDLLEQRIGIQFRVESDDSWAKVLEKAYKHDIDVLSSITKTPKRAEYLSFTAPFITPTTAIYTRDGTFGISQLEHLKNKSVAIENQFFLHEKLAKDYPEINLIPMNTTLEALNAVSYGKADAYVGNRGAANWIIQNNELNNLKISSKTDLGSFPLRFAVRDDWPVFQVILNKALLSITDIEMASIRRKWLGVGVDSDIQRLAITDSERQWLNDHKTIRMTGDPNWLPYEAFDQHGNYIGIVAEHLKLIEQKLGIEIDIIPSSSWSESLEKVKKGEVDILSETSDSSLKTQLTFTQPYISSPIIIVMKKDENYVENIEQIKQRKIAVIKDYGYVPAIMEKYPQIEFK